MPPGWSSRAPSRSAPAGGPHRLVLRRSQAWCPAPCRWGTWSGLRRWWAAPSRPEQSAWWGPRLRRRGAVFSFFGSKRDPWDGDRNHVRDILSLTDLRTSIRYTDRQSGWCRPRSRRTCAFVRSEGTDGRVLFEFRHAEWLYRQTMDPK